MAFDIKRVAGLGDGSLGDVTITSVSTQLNSYANVTAISADSKTLTINTSNASIGAFGGFVAGQDIIFHVTGCLGAGTADVDKYGFAKILSAGNGQVVLDTAIPFVDVTAYICQIVTIPNFNNLTVKCAVSALAFDVNKKYGGILIPKAKGLIDLSSGGSLLAEGKGIPYFSYGSNTLRPAGITRTNADLLTRLVMPQGNGIVIPIAKAITFAPNGSSRLGAPWTGAGTGGIGNNKQYPELNAYACGSPGGAGFGGGGGGGLDTSVSTYGGWGNGDIGVGGKGTYSSITPQGYAGVIPTNATQTYNRTDFGYAGATIMLIADVINNFTIDVFSTGGKGGSGGWSGGAQSGGGAGYGYIATNTAIPANTIAYALDTTLQISKKAFIQSKKIMDCSKATSVEGFSISSIQPAGTDTRVLFSLGAARVAGSRTFPITTNAVAGDTVTIAGVTFTAVSSGATGTQFNVGATIAVTAANIATALNSNATVSTTYLATADSSGTITLTEKKAGYGNNPAAATKTGTIVFGTGTAITSVPTWFKLTSSNGVASMTTAAPTQDLTVDSVLAEGNAVADLTGITSIPSFVGKSVYAAAAHVVPFGAAVAPALKLALKGHNNQDQYQWDEPSAEYHLADSDVSIVSVTADTATTGQASAAVTVSLKQNGTWSGWMSMIDTKDKKASDIKYKATYSVTKLDGTDTAKVNKVSVIYCAGTSTVSGDTAEILTITQNYDNSIGFAECLIKHKELMDAQIRSYVALRAAPKKRTMINVGTGNGKTQTVKLGIKDSQGNIVPDSGINHDTLAVQFDAKPTFGYGYNTEVSELTFTADNDVAVTASYEYGWEPETWVEMTKATTQPYNDTGHYGTKFEYEVPSGMDGKTISNMKTVLYRPSGTVTDEVIGTATGKKQLIVLPHFARKESIVCSGSWSYDDNSRILTVVDDKGNAIKISYSWIAETQEIYGLTAGWAEAE